MYISKMYKIHLILIFGLIFNVLSCDKPSIEKPVDLINEDKMINMLTDIHLAEATFKNRQYQDSLVMKSSSASFYYSVLEKYQIPDSVFEQSYLYYISRPKKFEKMYRQVMNKLNELEEEFSGRKREQLDLELKKENL